MPSYFDVFKRLRFDVTDTVVNYLTSAFVQRYRLSIVRNGVEATLTTLYKRYTLVCVTSREPLEEVADELRFLRIDRFFKHIVTRNVAAQHFGLDALPFFPFNAQRTMLYECALALAECSPSDAVVIGDMGRELEPARELGITTIGFLAHKARKNELQKTADFLILSINELPHVLLKMGKS